MNRKVALRFTLVLCLTIAGLAVFMGLLTSAAPSAPAQKIDFAKTASNPNPRVGEIFTFTWTISPTAEMTQAMRVRVTDPNPAPLYLEILTPTITGGAFYSATIDGVVWEGTVIVGSLPSPVSFQVRVTGIPTTAPESGYVVTNTAEMIDMSAPGSLPETKAEAAIRITGEPDITVDPLSLNTLLEPGGNTTRQLIISNTITATANLNWSLVESPTVTWLIEAPISDTASPGESDTVDVTFNATGLSDGIYNTTLRVNSNDPDEPAVNVDVVLTVDSCIPVSDADIITPTNPLVDKPATFTATVNAHSTTPIQYTWDFGDGTAPDQSGWLYAHTYVVQHTYTASDTYHVVMTATNCFGANTSVDSEDIVVLGEPGISVEPLSLSAVLNPNTSAGDTKPRELIISNAGDATTGLIWNLVETPTVSWLGEAPTSGVVTPSGSSDVKVTFNSMGQGPGTYTTTLRIRSNDLDDPVVDVDVTLEVVDDCIEVDGADFEFAPTGPLTTGVTVVFTGSVEQGSLPIDYVWSFGDGTLPVAQADVWAHTSVVAHTYTSSETGYNVTMRVSNSCSEDAASRRVGSPIIYLPLVLRNYPCIPANIAALDSDSPVELGEVMHFAATVTGNAPIVYAWDFGGAGTQGGTDTNPTFTYDAADTYTVTLTVTNACGTDSDFITVTMTSPCDPVDITAMNSDSPVVLGEAMHFTATVTGTQPITYAWDLSGAGSGSGTDGATPTYTYTAAGTYTVTLVVTNACGTDSDFITVTVSSAVGANFIPSTPPVSKITTLTTGVIPSNAVAAYAWNAGGRRRQ